MKTSQNRRKQHRRFPLGKGALMLVMAGTMMMGACTKEKEIQGPPVITPGPSPTQLVSIDLYGTVTDQSNNPVKGATVTIDGHQTTTDQSGVYALPDIRVNAKRAVLNASGAGYFKAFRAFIPREGSQYTMSVKMVKNNPTHTINAQTGGTATLSNGSEVKFPANAVVDEQGNSYSGTVQLAIQYLAPGDAFFGELLPGDLSAERTDGSEAVLKSFGMLNVELTGTSGQSLQIKDGEEAELTVAVPAGLQGEAPSTLPLWYFDEVLGMWKEEGEAQFNGSVYVGKVKHFTWWNCDMAFDPAYIEGRVVDCNGDPVVGVGIYDKLGGSGAWTDGNGNFSTRVIEGRTYELHAELPELGIKSQIEMVGPLSADELYTIPDFKLTVCPAYISGRLTDCDGNVADGMVYVSHSTDPVQVVFTTNGVFKTYVAPNEDYTLTGLTNHNEISDPISVTSGALGGITDMGDFAACPSAYENSFVIDGGIYSNEKIIFPTIFAPTATAWANYNSPILGITAYADDNNGVYYDNMIFGVKATTTGTYTSLSGDLTVNIFLGDLATPQDTVNLRAEDMTMEITDYPAVGGIVQGTFSGTVKDPVSNTQYTISNGKFAAIRQQ
ncbi:MAG: carboxypeptidase regulatory-like domain-containing protein [Flavobacteriales bacterium]|nr:carboxypeptidase regulatory-like domain-containing protein [Flavobacteriales bacterium]